MTYAPPTLTALGAYLVAHSAVNLGIVGDSAHAVTGTSYHLGLSQLSATAYSRQTARDKAGLSEAASAIDIGKINGSLPRLREFSIWFVGQCRANAPGTSDIREFIYSPDGVAVLRWDRERGYAAAPKPGEASASHTGHSHTSWYRDSEQRDKIGPFRGFFEEDDMDVRSWKAEPWTPNGTRRPVRSTPDRTAAGIIVGYIELGQQVISTAEISAGGNDWRGFLFKGAPGYILRSDFTPIVQGGATPFDATYQALLNGTLPPSPVVCPPPIDCTQLVRSAVATEYARVTAGTTVEAHFPARP